MSQKTIMTGIDKAARAPAVSRSARRSGLPLPDMVDRLLRARQKPLEPPLRPGELEREHSEPEDDCRDAGARRDEHDNAGGEDEEPDDRERGPVDPVSLFMPVPPRAHALDQRRAPARLVLSHVPKVRGRRVWRPSGTDPRRTLPERDPFRGHRRSSPCRRRHREGRCPARRTAGRFRGRQGSCRSRQDRR